MVRLSKKAEYGLIAMRHIAAHPREVIAAKEIAESYKIPQEILAKVLQKLARAGLVRSHQGVRGGYTLQRPASEVQVAEIIRAVEGSKPVITQCMEEGPVSCLQYEHCTIKSPLHQVQANIENAFSSMTLAQIV